MEPFELDEFDQQDEYTNQEIPIETDPLFGQIDTYLGGNIDLSELNEFDINQFASQRYNGQLMIPMDEYDEANDNDYVNVDEDETEDEEESEEEETVETEGDIISLLQQDQEQELDPSILEFLKPFEVPKPILTSEDKNEQLENIRRMQGLYFMSRKAVETPTKFTINGDFPINNTINPTQTLEKYQGAPIRRIPHNAGKTNNDIGITENCLYCSRIFKGPKASTHKQQHIKKLHPTMYIRKKSGRRAKNSQREVITSRDN
ncbi:hypothetical protein WICMUC_003186 [Wickerhamomyces mucosus]|uniref:Uncharacterized protein n=1 Tax=Wickerhamomyces mucosus TaxID=1378264 RepID=A0A9P8PNC5_9ASCO|nr:hypothetical protein WICMUC_003186 [Wickerhamomyces mucosus]